MAWGMVDVEVANYSPGKSFRCPQINPKGTAYKLVCPIYSRYGEDEYEFSFLRKNGRFSIGCADYH